MELISKNDVGLFSSGVSKIELEIILIKNMLRELRFDDGFVNKIEPKYDETGMLHLGHQSTGGGAERVFYAIWDAGWVLGKWLTEADKNWSEQLNRGTEFISSLSETQAHQLVSWMVRGNKWSEGFFGELAKRGIVTLVLEHLSDLKKLRCDHETYDSHSRRNPIALREDLIRSALWWQEKFGVAPQITSSVSEFDATRLVGMSFEAYSSYMQERTAVSKGADFVFKNVRYQVKANRPSGKSGSKVTIVSKANNYDWDQLIWILYDKYYIPKEAWLWHVDAYKRCFHSKKRLSPKDYRQGVAIDISMFNYL